MSTANIPKILTINGVRHDFSEPEAIRWLAEAPEQHLKELANFLADWCNDAAYISLQTSGSTGTPKQLRARKLQMLHSAGLTNQYFGLTGEATALLCMSPAYIGGRMMVVRALLGGFNLVVVEPGDNPLKHINQHIDFAAMVPFQFARALKNSQDKFHWIDKLLLGGAALPDHLEKASHQLNTAIWHSYGMSETLSHIALRRINGPEPSHAFRALPGIELKLDDRGCLIIEAPALHDEPLKTNDIAQLLPDGTFNILGRIDDVIISAGVKIHPVQLEHDLAVFFTEPIAIIAAADTEAGEVAVLVAQGSFSPQQLYNIWKQMEAAIDRSCMPRRIVTVDRLPLTGSGKVDRQAIKQMVNA
ncbi:MAG TPA: AMP-binding protein [Bacteroidales bacterium]|nr:AMP-binding protein [Bacteroidales bacterium]